MKKDSTPSSHIQAVADVASNWREADHPARRAAVERTLEAPNRWTEPALDHSLDRWMHRLTEEALTRWLAEDPVGEPRTIGVLHSDSDPFSGLRDAIGALVLGHSYVGLVPDASPALLPAFLGEVDSRLSQSQIRFCEDRDTLLAAADVLVAESKSGEKSLAEACEQHDLGPDVRLIRRPMFSIGVVDGHESEDEMERFAEDMLLYEGQGRRRLAILWAPEEHSPDAHLEAMARFRGLFPAHPDTPGTLQMQQAFLEARDQSHAYADGLEFLVSRGEAEPKRPGHVRWTEYGTVNEIATWWADQSEHIYAVIARPHLQQKLPSDWPLRSPGGVHIPPLDDLEGQQTVRFLRGVEG